MTVKYVLITPARNEEKYIEKTICSVVSQTILPQRWIIVSDGSTDKTEDIVKKYADDYAFIQLLRRAPKSSRNFGSKVYAIRAGTDCINELEYDFIGIMDADVSFKKNFFEKVIEKLLSNPKLGIGGGVLYELESNRWVRRIYSYEWSVAGPMQMFRRECYHAIGGYLPLKRGGVDMIAEVMSRMNGWQVQTFPDIKIYHYRITGTAKGNVLAWYFRRGMMEYTNGYHPAFQMVRFFSWILYSPVLIASLYRTAGYFWAFLKHEPLSVPEDIIRYLRKEQMSRIRKRLFLSKK